MRRNIVAGNWKMNLSLVQATKLVSEIINFEIPDKVDVILACPFPYLMSVNELIGKKENVFVAAQNCHYEESGAFTGEVSVNMLKSIGINCVVVGHSERRTLNNESDEMVKTKIDLLLAAEMEVIFCCGEPLEIREAKGQNGYVSQQLVDSLFHLSGEKLKNIIIAYEPIWAIGTGLTASPEQAQEMHLFLRTLLTEKYSSETASKVSILYGGSVNARNAQQLFSKPDVDGGLVGGASLESESFSQIIASF